MPELTPARLLRRHVTPFAITLVALTGLIGVNSFLARPGTGGASFVDRTGLLLLSMPATLSLTMPMAVFVAVLWVFTRLGREGLLASQRASSEGRHLVRSVTLAATAICALLLVTNVVITPRANARLSELPNPRPAAQTDRSMTLGELREAVDDARSDGETGTATSYQVEIQKKFALAASALFLALAAVALGIRYPRWDFRMVFAVSIVVLTLYYVTLIGGEVLAEAGYVSPFVGMWMGNWALLSMSVLLRRRSNRGGPALQGGA